MIWGHKAGTVRQGGIKANLKDSVVWAKPGWPEGLLNTLMAVNSTAPSRKTASKLVGARGSSSLSFSFTLGKQK
jgi:hypothetical protein